MIDWRKEASDQTAHIAAGLVLASIVSIAGADLSPVQGALAALGAGVVREFTEWQEWGKAGSQGSAIRHALFGTLQGGLFSSGSIRDYCGWIIGGLIGGLL